MMDVVVLEEAIEDIEDGSDFYESQSPGLGAYFTGSLVVDIEKLGPFHGIHSKHFGFHRALARRFPFGIYYREARNRIEVFAVLDLRREPTWIRAELSKRPV